MEAEIGSHDGKGEEGFVAVGGEVEGKKVARGRRGKWNDQGSE